MRFGVYLGGEGSFSVCAGRLRELLVVILGFYFTAERSEKCGVEFRNSRHLVCCARRTFRSEWHRTEVDVSSDSALIIHGYAVTYLTKNEVNK